MKKYLSLIFIIMFIGSLANAQYRINKKKYDFRSFSFEDGDKYSPIAAGVTSFLIPGLGQAISGEPLRGLAFFGGFTGCVFVTTIGLIRVVDILGTGISGDVPEPGGFAMMFGGGLGMYAVDIWSIIDAVRVAKVNNLAYRGKNKSSFNIELQPCIYQTYNIRDSNIQAGLTLKVNF